ncbi:hypothetical protein [Streptacidiphilus monticola]|uniref:Uncharacterized protein n=1 Tax=Streptacidiphilus monticola TaxID=2161674 RepID=A0ABW1GA67_9ACTN
MGDYPWTALCVVVVIAPWLKGAAFVCYGGALISRQPRARRT